MGDNIRFDIKDLRLEASEKVVVPVVVRFDKPTKVRGIHAEFFGAEKTQAVYTKTTTDSKGRVKTETHTATEYDEIVKEEFLLMGEERKGFFSRLGDSAATWVGGGSHEIVEAGEHKFPVTIQLPPKARASFKGKKCEVFYRLKVAVDLPIRIDWSEETFFEVVGIPVSPKAINPVHVVFPDENGRSFWDGVFGKDVTLNLALDRDTLSPGDTALAMLTVETPKPLNVSKIDVNIVGLETTEAHGHHDRYQHRFPVGEVSSPNVIANESVHEFEVVVPEIEGPYSQAGQKFDVSWSVQVQLKVPWAKDPLIEVPIKLIPMGKS